ncbi:MAG: YceH family protein [Bryobacteraceae bacterium]
MALELDNAEVRVLACLMEKEAATPEYYPLTLNALVNACNQKNSRDPVVGYGEETVERALAGLREKGLAVEITGRSLRVPKHAHRLAETFNLGRRESAVLCELMLRGPQTPGELRSRTERLYHFEDLESVEATLDRLAEWQPDALVAQLPRHPGSREARYTHLLSGAPPTATEAPRPLAAPSESNALAELQQAVEGLQREVADLREQLRRLTGM